MIKTPLSTVIGGAFWTPSATILGSTSKTFDQLIKSIFANNEQGFVYDPNDLSTMYQDAAGTVPVTGVGQPVGLMLDKSKGLVLGDNVATGFTSGFIPTGSVAADLANSPTGAISSNWFPVTPSAFYKIQAPISNRCRVQVKNASGVITYLTAYSSDTSADARLVAASADSVFMRVYFANEAIGSQVTTFEARKLTGNHAYQTTSASRPILRQNAITGAYYLEFDGSDDFFVTNSINFTSTDKISLFAGVVKFATSVRILCELSADMNTDAGSFYLTAPETADGRYSFKSRGSGLSNAAMTALSSATSANDAAVISASGSISGDTNKIRRNAVATSSTYELGAGNYGNYPLYIGRRGGVSLPFNGHIYSLIGIGRLTTDAETTALEKLIAKNTGVTLSV